MCGIAGIFDPKQADTGNEAVVRRMVEILSHRGPDDEGFFCAEAVTLGHRRLSIIDTSSAGHQPMVSKDGRYALVFNGEIYNFRELRAQYFPREQFVSDSDTEVLLRLLIDQGEAALPILRGMFAFAFWDNDSGELMLARDPFGKKPLYYADIGSAFVFASETKAIVSHPAFVCSLDAAAAGRYFLHEYVPAPQTGFEGIHELLMGHYMRVSRNGKTWHQWRRPIFLPKRGISERAALEQIDSLLRQAVERRLTADVPVGVFLSGGLDSTTIAWYMRKQKPEVHSFSISFEDKSFDELPHARLAADALGTVHHNRQFTVDDFKQSVSELNGLIDIPLADASLLPTYALSRMASKHVKVVLDGDGSDELLGGYGTFKAGEAAEALRFVPRFMWQAARALASQLPVSHDYFSFDFKVKSFLQAVSMPPARRNQAWLGAFLPQDARKLFRGRLGPQAEHMFDGVDALVSDETRFEVFDVISDATIRHYLHNAILVKLDRATMYASIEARTPFLDIDLAEFIMRLPVGLKRNKALLKKLMRGRIPDAIIDRPKKGFGIPIGAWFQNDLYGWLADVLAQEKIEADGLLQFEYISHLLAEHRAGVVDHRKKLWALAAFQMWYDRWVANRPNRLNGKSRYTQGHLE